MEIWKDIIGYEGRYQISNLGNVKSFTRTEEGFMMKAHLIKGYYSVKLSNGHRGDKKESAIHRLVAQAFIPNPDNKPQVNHIDGNKHNNNAENLEWVTNGENGKHAFKNHLREHTTLYKKVKVVYKDGSVKIFKSMQEAATDLGVTRQAVTRCCRGLQRTVKGCDVEWI